MVATRIGKFAFWFFSLALVVVSMRFVWIGGQRAFPASYYLMQLKPVTMTTHILASCLAMTLLPFQFWNGFHTTHPRLHRIMGTVCAGSILVSGVAAASLGLSSRYGDLGVVGFFTGASLWVIATVLAVWFIFNGNVAAHRTWMIIVATLSFGAVTIRLEMPFLLVVFGVTGDFNVALTSWTCWAVNLMVLAWWHRHALIAGQVRFA